MQAMSTLDQFDFHTRLAESRGPAVVLFHSPGCSSCRHWRQLLADYGQIHHRVAFYQVDVQQDMALAQEFELFHLPALFLYLDGRFHCELQVEARLERFQRVLTDALKAPPQEAP